MFDQPTDSKSKKDATKKDFEKILHKMIASAQQPVKTEKIYPNDPCPYGSGKKYKKCCMNKAADKKEELTMAADRKKWLESYPEDPGCRIEGHIYLSDFYDREAIETDKLVYLALSTGPNLLPCAKHRNKKSNAGLIICSRPFPDMWRGAKRRTFVPSGNMMINTVSTIPALNG